MADGLSYQLLKTAQYNIAIIKLTSGNKAANIFINKIDNFHHNKQH